MPSLQSVWTGQHKIISTKICYDVGRSLNPAIDIGQIEGGYLQGVGWLTMEKPLIADNSVTWAKPGTNLTTTFAHYKIPAMSDVPGELEVRLLPNSNKSPGVLSSKSVGDAAIILANSVGLAIVHAIRAARKGKGLNANFPLEFPMTIDKISKLCGN